MDKKAVASDDSQDILCLEERFYLTWKFHRYVHVFYLYFICSVSFLTTNMQQRFIYEILWMEFFFVCLLYFVFMIH